MAQFIAGIIVTAFFLAGAGGAFGQVAPAAPSPQGPAASPQLQAPIPQDTGDPRQTRQRLNEILRQYPPAVGEVLRLDHSLLIRPDYLAPYPALGAFIAQHPEIIRNPSFFFGEVFDREPPDARSRTINMFENVLGGPRSSRPRWPCSECLRGSFVRSSSTANGCARPRRRPTCIPSCSIA